MLNSRDLKDLNPEVAVMAHAFIDKCKEAGIDLLVTSTYRDWESQTALYNQGRTTPGAIVTNAKAGQSFHNYRCAMDVVPLRNGKCVWDGNDPLWAQVGKIGESVGLEWAAHWPSFRELAHFQYTGGKTIQQLLAAHTSA